MNSEKRNIEIIYIYLPDSNPLILEPIDNLYLN